jgi:hypothetical protein
LSELISKPLQINEIRRIRGGTLNDVVTSALSGAMRKYAQDVVEVTKIPSPWTVTMGNVRYLAPGSDKDHILALYHGGFVNRLPTDQPDPVSSQTFSSFFHSTKGFSTHSCEVDDGSWQIWLSKLGDVVQSCVDEEDSSQAILDETFTLQFCQNDSFDHECSRAHRKNFSVRS